MTCGRPIVTRDEGPVQTLRTALNTAQGQLFGTDGLLPHGLIYAPEFVSADEERALLELAAALPIVEARYKSYTARRRVYVWGEQIGEEVEAYYAHRHPLAGLPPPLHALRERVAAWAALDAATFVHVMISEYRAGTPLGWHRDAPQYEVVAGVSLGGPARLRFRPWPPSQPKRQDVVALELVPRSAYLMRGPARWAWQHSLAPVPGLRWSVTLRTARG
jgi:alkylated DNA repair dioxygenase AlkB